MTEVKKVKTELIPLVNVEDKIINIRGKNVLLDHVLAALYGVHTNQLKRQVRRNLDRFPEDFMFELRKEEYDALRCQLGTLKRGQHSKYLPFAFTEQGIAMLSSVLNSKRAIQVNIAIMRIFVKIRKIAHPNILIAKKIKEFQEKLQIHDEDIQTLFETINLIALASIQKKLAKPKEPPKKIGFH